jgi:hypothetical protein
VEPDCSTREPGKLVRVLYGDETKQSGVHDGEERRVSANSERQGNNRNGSESWRAPKTTESVKKIAGERGA